MEGQRKGKGGVGGRGSGGRGGGGGKQSSAQDFLGFHYERPSVNAPSGTPKRTKRAPVVVATKEESVHASFRFIVSALSNPLEPALYDPDCVLPWEMVECVVVPLNQEHTLLCPICLDTVHCPRITKCGHTFCIPCLLRHMQSDRSNAQKCPMCMEYIWKSDLRSVMFMYDHWDAEDTAMAVAQAATGSGSVGEDAGLLHPFYVFQPYRGQVAVDCLEANARHAKGGGDAAVTGVSTTATSTATSTATVTVTALQVQQPYTFHHLIVEKGNCRPHLPQKLLRFVLDHPHASATTATATNGRAGSSSSSLSSSMRRSMSSSSTVSSSIGGSLAEHLASLQRVLPNEVADEEARYARLMYRPWAVSCVRWQQEEAILRSWQTELVREQDLDGAACLVQALEMVQQTRDERTKFLQSHFLVDVPDFYTPPTSASASPVVYEGSRNTTTSLPSLLDNDALYQHLYQSIHGDAVYLHPLCQRALQAEYEQQQQQRGGYGGGGGGTWPPVVTGRVIDIEYVRLGGSNRDKPAYLRHLPAYTAISIVELDMKKLVSREIYEQFASEFARRQQKRREKKKQEQRHERHVAQKHRQAQQHQQYQQYSGDDLYFDDFAYSQHFPTATATATVGAVSDDADIATIEAAFAALAASSASSSSEGGLSPPPPAPPIAASSPPVARFAEITQMHGHFPTLGGPSSSSGTAAREGSGESIAAASTVHGGSGSGSGSSGTGSSAIGGLGTSKARSGGVVSTAAIATSNGGRPVSLAPASSLSLVANKKPTNATVSTSSLSLVSTSATSVSSTGSKSLIRSAVLASSTATTTNAATGGFTFTLEDALKNSRGKVQKKGAKKTTTTTASTTAAATAAAAVDATVAGSSAETTTASSV